MKQVNSRGNQAVKFLIEVGKLKSAKGWLSRIEAEEALALVRELRLQGAKDIHIYETENFALVTETTLERYVKTGNQKH